MKGIIAALLLTTLTAQAPAPTTLIHAGALLAEPGSPPRGPSTIVIRGATIAEVRDGFVDVPGARVVDLKTSFVLPGLIDSHVHLGGLEDRRRARLEESLRDAEDETLTALRNARVTLQAGFTTVRDLGGEPRLIATLRDAVAAGEVEGPTILMAARGVTVTSGHGSALNGRNRTLTEARRSHITNLCDGPEDCRRATRAQIGEGADVIKFAATGGVLSNVAGGLRQQMMADEMKAIVETARMFGRKVAAHAHGADGVNAALEAGVDSIEHGTFTDDRTFALYRSTGAYYVPTLLAPAAADAMGKRGDIPPASAAKAAEAAGNAIKSFGRAVRERVKIAFGTDTGVSPHGRNAEEFALMVGAGMTPAAAIRSATVDAAELLGLSARVGRITPGRDADIIAVAASPLSDVRELERVRFVMRRGVVHRLDGARQLMPLAD